VYTILNKEDNMKLSARNILKGKVVEIKKGAVMAKVKLDIGGGNKVTALISVDSVQDLKLKKGDKASAIIKSTEVIIGK
jgi:molybdopterin-binding protein